VTTDWGPGDPDYDDAATDARIERDRESKLRMFHLHGPEYWEDWMGDADDDAELL
jgi:hypothetical protein